MKPFNLNFCHLSPVHHGAGLGVDLSRLLVFTSARVIKGRRLLWGFRSQGEADFCHSLGLLNHRGGVGVFKSCLLRLTGLGQTVVNVCFRFDVIKVLFETKTKLARRLRFFLKQYLSISNLGRIIFAFYSEVFETFDIETNLIKIVII